MDQLGKLCLMLYLLLCLLVSLWTIHLKDVVYRERSVRGMEEIQDFQPHVSQTWTVRSYIILLTSETIIGKLSSATYGFIGRRG
jgi:hypothetical protein